jgi:hypothetical protein
MNIEVDSIESVNLTAFLSDFSHVLFFYLSILVFFELLELVIKFIMYWRGKNAQ